ncbi:MAG TPA: hypothetical protein VGM06_14095 [Polyangiaceae bacterium]|jgi:hypothetical protein
MNRQTSPTLVYEWVSDLELLVSCQGVESPTDAEWDGYLACVAVMRKTEAGRSLVMTRGGRPSREQQARLMVVTDGVPARVAVISPAGALRFIVSILALVNPHIESFHPSQQAAAFEHIGLSPEHHDRVHRVVERLQKKLLRPVVLVAG